ncbi:MAG TPA: hypothetical protein DEF45_04445 [Rhodopirellula sp.]|nr:hypothetical protein [Rhodopirellula sp.]
MSEFQLNLIVSGRFNDALAIVMAVADQKSATHQGKAPHRGSRTTGNSGGSLTRAEVSGL